MSTPFVGRAPELDVLAAAIASAERDDAVAAAFVVGEPGNGKSRLLAEAAARASIEHVALAGYEPERAISLAATRPLLRRLTEVPSLGSELDRLVFGDAPGAPDALRVFEAAHRALSVAGPIVITLDDVQWVDETSRALCHYLLRAALAEGVPLALLAASRPAADASAFAASVSKVVPNLARIELGGLGEEAGMELARSLSPELDERAAAEVWRRSGGSPFWLQVLLGEEEAEVDAVLEARLGGVGPEAIPLLSLLALAGRPLEPEEAAGALGADADGVRSDARELVRAGLVIPVESALTVSHDLIRAAAVERVPEAQRPVIHARLAEFLEARATTDAALLQALHHRRAGGLPALDLARRLVASPRRRLLGGEGLALLAAVADEDEPKAVAELNAGLAALASELGEHQEAMDRAVAAADLLPEPGARSRTHLLAADEAAELRRAAEARHHLERAREEASDDPVLGLEIAALEAGVLQWAEVRLDEARAAAHRVLLAARAVAETAGGADRLDPVARRAYLRGLLAASDAGLARDEPTEVLALAEETEAAAKGVDDVARLRAMGQRGLALRLLGRTGEAEAPLRRAFYEARRRIFPRMMLEVGWLLVNTLHSLGRLEEAEEIASELRSLEERIALSRPSRIFAITLPHLIELSRVDWRPAVDGLRDEADREADPHLRLHTHFWVATALARIDPRGSEAEIRTRLASAADDARSADCRRCASEVRLRTAEALARLGDLEGARAALAADESDRMGGDAWRAAYAALADGAIRAAEGDVEGLEGFIEEAERQGLAMEALWARLHLGRVLAERDRAAGAEALRSAGEWAERIGARTEQRIAEQGLRALGVRTWRRGAAAGELTEREREIAGLVAAGASNPEIAGTLFLSRKTVERHVSNVLAKLGLSNRAQLAARIRGAAAPPGEDEGPPR